MKIYLCDREYTARDKSEWHNALTSALPDHFKHTETRDWNEPEEFHPAYSDADAVIFCHSNAGEPAWRRKAAAVDCHIVLARRSGRQKQEEDAKGNLHGCHWSPAEFITAAREGSPQRLALWIHRAQTKNASEAQWSLLRAAATERLWALRLLCEAYELPETKKNIPKDWISLLKEKESEMPGDVITAIKANIDELGVQIGTDEKAAIDKLLGIFENGQSPNDNDASTVRSCREALEKLLGIQEERHQNQAAKTG